MTYEDKLELAKNPNIIPEVQLKLANDKSQGVRCYLARNPNTTDEVLLKLMANDNQLTRDTATKNMKARIK